MSQVITKDIVYALFTPINVRYAPDIEKIRSAAISLLFNPDDALVKGKFIRSRYVEDSYGEDAGPAIDFTERGLAAYRILDLINKTELKSLFIGPLEWFQDYPVKGTQRLKFVYNVFNSYRNTVTSSKIKRQLVALGVPEPTCDTISTYLTTDDPIDYVSACCAIILLGCLTSLGNRGLIRKGRRAS